VEYSDAGACGNGIGFPHSTAVFPCHYQSTNTQYSFFSTVVIDCINK